MKPVDELHSMSAPSITSQTESVDPRKCTVTLMAYGNGTTVPEVGTQEMNRGSTISISGSPMAAWQFVGWIGEVKDPYSASTSVTVDRDKMITAVFGAQKRIHRKKRERTYVDQNGVRRCNRLLKSGTICGNPAVEKEGRNGPFWSCPNFKEHD